MREPVGRRRVRGVAARHRAVRGGTARPQRARGAVFVDAFDVEQVPASRRAPSSSSASSPVPALRRPSWSRACAALVELREVEPGIYEGTYVIDAGDRLRAASTAVATVWRDGAVVRATLEESLAARRRAAGAPGLVPRPPRSPSPGSPAPDRRAARAGAGRVARRPGSRRRAFGRAVRRRVATAPWSSRSAPSRCRPARPLPARSPAASSARCSARRSARPMSAM